MNTDRQDIASLNTYRELIHCSLLCLILLPTSLYAQVPQVADTQSIVDSKPSSIVDSKLKTDPSLTTKEKRTFDTQDILSKVQKFYAQAIDFKAEFKQTYTYQIYGRKKISTGKVYFKKPAKMRWDYEVPTQRVFVADGQTLWVYEPAESQVFKRDLNSAQLPVALRFMRGDAQLDKEFNVQSIDSSGSSTIVTLILTPKTPSPDFKTLELHVRSTDGQVQSSVLIDPIGNRNRIDFVDVKVNQDLPNSGFSFTPPQGVRVIDEESSR